MEKFSIGEEEEYENKGLNPIFLRALPKYIMEKGMVVANHLSKLVKCVLSKERKGLVSVFFQSVKKVNRLLGFEDEYIYSYEKARSGLIVREVWHLRRLFKIEIKKENHQHMFLFFVNKSLNPADAFKVKELHIQNSKEFLHMLKKQLESCDIDLEI